MIYRNYINKLLISYPIEQWLKIYIPKFDLLLQFLVKKKERTETISFHLLLFSSLGLWSNPSDKKYQKILHYLIKESKDVQQNQETKPEKIQQIRSTQPRQHLHQHKRRPQQPHHAHHRISFTKWRIPNTSSITFTDTEPPNVHINTNPRSPPITKRRVLIRSSPPLHEKGSHVFLPMRFLRHVDHATWERDQKTDTPRTRRFSPLLLR